MNTKVFIHWQAYVQDEVKLLDAISIVAGIRYAYNEKFKSQFTPKLSLMYQYSGLNVRASYSRRIPFTYLATNVCRF
ncbi:TonB-dependent receptor [Phocaeicola vulgatus]|nr:TonB-dependent receptor [Phocaeicola vulgatus]